MILNKGQTRSIIVWFLFFLWCFLFTFDKFGLEIFNDKMMKSKRAFFSNSVKLAYQNKSEMTNYNAFFLILLFILPFSNGCQDQSRYATFLYH